MKSTRNGIDQPYPSDPPLRDVLRRSFPAITTPYRATYSGGWHVDCHHRDHLGLSSHPHLHSIDRRQLIGSRSSDRGVGTPGDDHVTRINNVVLPDAVTDVVEDYEAVIGERDRFLWKWIYSLFPAFTLSTVPRDLADTVRIQKTILTIFVTILDDLAEKQGDGTTFEEIRSVVFPGNGTVDDRTNHNDVVDCAVRIWSEFESRIADAPYHSTYRDVFNYDVRQVVNSMEYSRLLNDNLWVANINGVEHYGPHNMVMFPFVDIDIMHSPSFESNDVGRLREVIWDLQKLARIGNWLTTWEREIREGDYSAGIVIYALQTGVISIDELLESEHRTQDELIQRIKSVGIEDRFLSEWWQRYRNLSKRVSTVGNVDIRALISGMETVLEYHLSSYGYK